MEITGALGRRTVLNFIVHSNCLQNVYLVFYTTLNDSVWTDSYVNYAGAADSRNHNIPGDGKYDIDFLTKIKTDGVPKNVKPNTLSHLEVKR
jgi:hypothetical protein